MRAGDVGQNAAVCCSGSYLRAILERKMSCRVACEGLYIYVFRRLLLSAIAGSTGDRPRVPLVKYAQKFPSHPRTEIPVQAHTPGAERPVLRRSSLAPFSMLSAQTQPRVGSCSQGSKNCGST